MRYYGPIWPKVGNAKQHAVRLSHNDFEINNLLSGLCSDTRSQAGGEAGRPDSQTDIYNQHIRRHFLRCKKCQHWE